MTAERTPHTLGAILMRLEVMEKGEFQYWLSSQGYTPEEVNKIRDDVIAQKKKPGHFSYGKVY